MAWQYEGNDGAGRMHLRMGDQITKLTVDVRGGLEGRDAKHSS